MWVESDGCVQVRSGRGVSSMAAVVSYFDFFGDLFSILRIGYGDSGRKFLLRLYNVVW